MPEAGTGTGSPGSAWDPGTRSTHGVPSGTRCGTGGGGGRPAGRRRPRARHVELLVPGVEPVDGGGAVRRNRAEGDGVAHGEVAECRLTVLVDVARAGHGIGGRGRAGLDGDVGAPDGRDRPTQGKAGATPGPW